MKLKHFFGLFLAIILILGVCGCININFASEREILKYLENKYNEKFVVVQTGWANNEIIAYAHPAGRETERFTVRFEGSGNSKKFSDGYGLIFAEEAILPVYEAFMAEALPDAKFTMRVIGIQNVTRETHSKGATFEEIVAKEPYMGISIKIFVSDELLSDKESFFEELIHILYAAPNRELNHGYEIAFVKAEQFADFDAAQHKWTSGLEYGREFKEIAAYTVTSIRTDLQLQDSLDFLNFWFVDTSNLPDEPRIDS
jgi:hypothetical protein